MADGRFAGESFEAGSCESVGEVLSAESAPCSPILDVGSERFSWFVWEWLWHLNPFTNTQQGFAISQQYPILGTVASNKQAQAKADQ